MTERPRIVIVTGARRWPANCAGVVGTILRAHSPTLVVHGGAEEGVDWFAEQWCRSEQIDSRAVRAYWGRHPKIDRGAGHARNARMLALYPDAPVLAFPFGKSSGTRGCMRRAVDTGHIVLVFSTIGQLVDAADWFP